jgi:hypothetical protein
MMWQRKGEAPGKAAWEQISVLDSPHSCVMYRPIEFPDIGLDQLDDIDCGLLVGWCTV